MSLNYQTLFPQETVCMKFQTLFCRKIENFQIVLSFKSFKTFKSFYFAQKVLNPYPSEPGYEPVFANSVDPDQLASEEANWSGSALFVKQYVNLYH